jgi:hypothetical protein
VLAAQLNGDYGLQLTGCPTSSVGTHYGGTCRRLEAGEAAKVGVGVWIALLDGEFGIDCEELRGACSLVLSNRMGGREFYYC